LQEFRRSKISLSQKQQHLTPGWIGNSAKDIRCIEWPAHIHVFTKT